MDVGSIPQTCAMKEIQKKLIIEIMEADEELGLYSPLV
jgi:hypothetical protein